MTLSDDDKQKIKRALDGNRSRCGGVQIFNVLCMGLAESLGCRWSASTTRTDRHRAGITR